MAYAALVSLSQLLGQILHHHRSFYIPESCEKQILESLHDKVSSLQAFLDNYSHKAGEAIRTLEARIRDSAYQAQDIVEFHISDRIRSDYQSSGVGSCFRQLILGKERSSTIQNKYQIELLKAVEQIDSIFRETANMQVFCRFEDMQISRISSSASPNGRNKMVGFDDDMMKIKGRLCGESSKLEIVPIVGMGGMGKTTLARNVFDDSLIAYRFYIRAWITISQEYNLRDILLCLVDFLPAQIENVSKKSNEELIVDIYKSLKGRTYLIIMDDMWSGEAWDGLRRVFPDDNNGSRIMITTRLTGVAEYAASHCAIHQMHFLNEDESWDLLREKVFMEQSCPPELEKIGRAIAANCSGLPLAIAVIAGILTKVDMSQYQWMNIAKDISLAMEATDESFSKVLTLSYDHLPNHLKPCFLYIGRFPEDYEIPVSKLIKVWVAEGFLKPIGSKSLEEVAEEYLEDLVKRNLVLITKKRPNGKFKLCSLHDLLRDLCIRKAHEEKFLHVYKSGRDTAKRRITILSNIYVERVSKNTLASSPIRSVLYLGNQWGLFYFVLQLRLLRVLDAHKIKLDYFPVEITELFHLRYLVLSIMAKQKRLPKSISKLVNLQTLILHTSQIIPLQIWKLPQLRHLILTNAILLIPGGHFLVQENLQSLCGVANLNLTRKVLDMVPNLKKLKVGLSKAKRSKLCLNNLVHLHQLEKLSLEFNCRTGRYPFPASYALPPNLKKLTLRGCASASGDMSVIGSLPNLEVVKLKDFGFVERHWETKEGEFSRLKFLLIHSSNLARWETESTHFPCLQHLVIRFCKELDQIPAEVGDIATLEFIDVDRNSKSAADSALLIQEEQQSLGNHILRVRLR